MKNIFEFINEYISKLDNENRVYVLKLVSKKTKQMAKSIPLD